MSWGRRNITKSEGQDEDGLRLAARALSRYGMALGWGIFGCGLWAAFQIAFPSPPDQARSAPAGLAAAAVTFAALALVAGLLGWGVALTCRLVSAVLLKRDERARTEAERRGVLVEHTAAALERAAAALERTAAALEGATAARGLDITTRFGSTGPADDRAEALARIDQAIHEARWADADATIVRFVEERPDDPAGPLRRERLETARRSAAQDRLAELTAARQVNDPSRALDLFLEIAPLLDAGARHDLERELASWFLDVIQRRLRAVKIQPEVVALASRVAETFRATVAGASLHAALPTLRRSVGLCPRCARPYRGTADACPECRSGAVGPEPEARSGPLMGGPEPEAQLGPLMEGPDRGPSA